MKQVVKNAMKQEQEQALVTLRSLDHAFVGPDVAESISQPFGFRAWTKEHKANPQDPKGLTLKNGAKSAVGVDAAHLAIQICNHLGLEFSSMFGRGSQLRACCDSIENYINKKS